MTLLKWMVRFLVIVRVSCQYLGWLLSKETQTDLIEMQMAYKGTAWWASLYPITNAYGADVWTYSEYAQLLDIQQNYLNMASNGRLSCKEALNQTALLQQRIMDTTPSNTNNQ